MRSLVGTVRTIACASLWCAILLSSQARPAAEGARTFAIDPVASQVRIELGRAGLLGFLGHDHTIAAPIAEGRVETSGATLQQSRLVLRFQSADLTIVPGTEPKEDIPEVEQRMRGPDVLDVERFPTVDVTATVAGATLQAPGDYRLRLRGSITLRGRTEAIDVPVAVRIDGDVLTAKGDVELKLTDLGITPPSVAAVVKMDNRFTVTFDVTARARPAQAASQGDTR